MRSYKITYKREDELILVVYLSASSAYHAKEMLTADYKNITIIAINEILC